MNCSWEKILNWQTNWRTGNNDSMGTYVGQGSKYTRKYWKKVLMYWKLVHVFKGSNKYTRMMPIVNTTHYSEHYRSSRPEVFCKKGAPNNFTAKFKIH